jgi:hypothetical protein
MVNIFIYACDVFKTSSSTCAVCGSWIGCSIAIAASDWFRDFHHCDCVGYFHRHRATPRKEDDTDRDDDDEDEEDVRRWTTTNASIAARARIAQTRRTSRGKEAKSALLGDGG